MNSSNCVQKTNWIWAANTWYQSLYVQITAAQPYWPDTNILVSPHRSQHSELHLTRASSPRNPLTLVTWPAHSHTRVEVAWGQGLEVMTRIVGVSLWRTGQLLPPHPDPILLDVPDPSYPDPRVLYPDPVSAEIQPASGPEHRRVPVLMNYPLRVVLTTI